MWTWIWLSCECIKNMASCQTRASSPCTWNLHWLWCLDHSWKEETSRRSIGNKFLHQSLCQQKKSKNGWEKLLDQPHAAYAALSHGLFSKWTYLMKTQPDISDLLKPLEETIRHSLPPALTERTGLNDMKKKLIELPARLGGLGIMNPTKCATIYHNNSLWITAPLTTLILQQEKASIKRLMRSERRSAQTEEARSLHEELPPKLQRSMDLGSEKGASRWLMSLPIADHNFALHKGSFQDALCMRYGWQPSLMPSNCVCGVDFSIEHALSCSCGGLPSIQHNDIRDLTAKLLTEVCSNVFIYRTQLTATYRRSTQPQVIQYRRRSTSGRMYTSFWGDRHQRAFLMWGFLTLLQQATAGSHLPPHTGNTSPWNEDSTNKSGKLGMAPSRH